MYCCSDKMNSTNEKNKNLLELNVPTAKKLHFCAKRFNFLTIFSHVLNLERSITDPWFLIFFIGLFW